MADEEHDEFSDKTTLVRSTQRSRFGADGIVRHTITDESELTADETREVLALHSKQIGGKKIKIIVFTGDLDLSTKNVRAVFSHADTVKAVAAAAIVAKSGSRRFFSNLAFTFSSAGVPIKYVATEEAALDWLKAL